MRNKKQVESRSYATVIEMNLRYGCELSHTLSFHAIMVQSNTSLHFSF